ncbi:hypothetical protein V8C44DRAFT_333594 [Trichoderma aethiopicum]
MMQKNKPLWREREQKEHVLGEARTHDLQMAQTIVWIICQYETDALANCATKTLLRAMALIKQSR